MAEQKIKVSVSLTGRIVTSIDAEAKRLGISFSDQVRRALDEWEGIRRTRDVVRVLDKEHGRIMTAR